MGVEVDDVGGLQVGLPQSALHGQRLTVPFGVRLDQIVAIGRHACTSDGAVDGGPPGLGVLEGFNHEHGSALAEHEAVAVDVPGPRGRLRVVVAAREGVHVGERCDGQRVDD